MSSQRERKRGRERERDAERESAHARAREKESQSMFLVFCHSVLYMYRGTSLIRNAPPQDHHTALGIALLL